MKLLAVFFLLVSIGGCASIQQYTWVRAWPGPNELYRDRAKCDYEVVAATQIGDPRIRNPIVNLFDTAGRRIDLFGRCMRANGWERVPVGAAPVVVATQPEVRETVVIAAPVSALPMAAKEKVPQGKFALQAERVAITDGCVTNSLARMTVSGPGFETYSVACKSGDVASIRCEFGNCRVLK